MGLRHARHRFMPNVLVFPGGRVDRADHHAAAASELPDYTAGLPGAPAPRRTLARALGVAAVRELFEETGLVLGRLEGERPAARPRRARLPLPGGDAGRRCRYASTRAS